MTDSTHAVTVNDREISFKAPTDGQILVLSRLMRGAKQIDTDDPEQINLGLTEMSKILDIIDAMIEDPIDRDWVEEQMIKGTLDLNALLEGFQDAVNGEGNRATKRAAKKTTSRARKR